MNAVFLEREDYIQMFDSEGFQLVDEFVLNHYKKMTTAQAKEELRFACKEAPHIFSNFGIYALDFTELWNEFGAKIESHGLAYWSTIHCIIFSKV